MLFSSWEFLPFIVIVLGLYYVLPHRWQNILLLVSSYVFYGSWDWRFLLLLMFSTTVDWRVTTWMQKYDDNEKMRKALLLVSIFVNLGLLGFFKYFNFFGDQFVSLAGLFGIHTSHFFVRVILPVGISFYTFQSLSYVIDCYRRQQTVIKSFVHVAAFVSFFPQLVAGPIQRAKWLAPQIMNPRHITHSQIREGLWLCLWGLTKKVVIADNVATIVDQVFGNQAGQGGMMTLFAILAFTVQIYCDFSGYTDIARGLAKLMGIELPRNFNLPYLALNPADFWHRWHISLSTWLRDYLYIPLGGNRKGRRRTYINLFLTMLIGGLWHGAAWTFVIWGAFHGTMLMIHRLWSVDSPMGDRVAERLPAPVVKYTSWAGMFAFTMLGWLLFRASSMAQVGSFLRDIFTNFAWSQAAAQSLFILGFFALILIVVEAWIRNADDPINRPLWKEGLGGVAVACLILAVILLAPPVGRSFIYFQF